MARGRRRQKWRQKMKVVTFQTARLKEYPSIPLFWTVFWHFLSWIAQMKSCKTAHSLTMSMLPGILWQPLPMRSDYHTCLVDLRLSERIHTMFDLPFVKFLFRIYIKTANFHRATIFQRQHVMEKKTLTDQSLRVSFFPIKRWRWNQELVPKDAASMSCIWSRSMTPSQPSPVRTKTLAWWWRWCQRQLWQVGFSNGCSWRALATPNPFWEPKTPTAMGILRNFEYLKSFIKVLVDWKQNTYMEKNATSMCTYFSNHTFYSWSNKKKPNEETNSPKKCETETNKQHNHTKKKHAIEINRTNQSLPIISPVPPKLFASAPVNTWSFEFPTPRG